MSQEAFQTARSLRENISQVVLGKPDVVELLTVALLAQDRLLLYLARE